jgi:divalent metal cation (Fe/Co/Zn/Cd) transporter
MTWALVLAAGYLIVEIVGGLISNSLALLADAGHMATDVSALGLALWAMRLTTKPATPRKTYGYHRAEILAALANGAVLVMISFFVLFEVGGLIINGVAAWLLEGGRHESLNVRAAWLHVISDALGSIGVIVGAALILAFGWAWADPAAACLIAALILYSAWSLLKEAVDVLMASAPGELSTDAVRHLGPRDVDGARKAGALRGRTRVSAGDVRGGQRAVWNPPLYDPARDRRRPRPGSGDLAIRRKDRGGPGSPGAYLNALSATVSTPSSSRTLCSLDSSNDSKKLCLCSTSSTRSCTDSTSARIWSSWPWSSLAS